MDITSAELAYHYLKERVAPDVEEFWALALGPKKTLLQSRMLFRGTVDACLVHPRDVFRFACSENASALLISHNHPSGDLYPSEQDLQITEQLINAGRILEIPILDHIILTVKGYSSFAEKRWCRFQVIGPMSARRQPSTGNKPGAGARAGVSHGVSSGDGIADI